jgi:uncharacterized protein (TIGR00369 family)
MSNISGFDVSKTAMATLGIELVEYTRDRVVASMPVTWKTHNPFGILHGGVSVVMAETVASAGSYLFIDRERQSAVGLEINANHIKSVAGGVVRAVGKPVHVGKKTLVWEVRILDETDDLVCISRCTVAVLDSNRTGDTISK